MPTFCLLKDSPSQVLSITVGSISGAGLAVWNQILGEREATAEVSYAAIAQNDADF
jgi:hypothetical protein